MFFGLLVIIFVSARLPAGRVPRDRLASEANHQYKLMQASEREREKERMINNNDEANAMY